MGQFEGLKMKEEEKIGEYLLRVDEVVNAIRGFGGKLKEKIVVRKVLRTLPMKYDSKISTLEERDDIDLMTIDQLHGILTAYVLSVKMALLRSTTDINHVGTQKENLDSSGQNTIDVHDI